MPALKEIARKAAGEIREGICWVVIYRVGRSWYSTTLHTMKPTLRASPPSAG